jgi:hypothetical protein
MGTLMALVLAAASGTADAWSVQPAIPATVLLPNGGSSDSQPTERIVLRKDGGPGHGPDQPYYIREQGAADLERFVGGKYIFFVGPWDLIVLILIVILVVVLIIAL